jgi:hypothetical protein
VVTGNVADLVNKTAEDRRGAAAAVSIPFANLKTLAMLGAGTFGRVSLVQNKTDPAAVYALKALHKSEIVLHKQEANVMNEKNIMLMCQHPFILRLFATYKDPFRLYMLLEFCPGGELFTVLHTPTRVHGALENPLDRILGFPDSFNASVHVVVVAGFFFLPWFGRTACRWRRVAFTARVSPWPSATSATATSCTGTLR